jgi:hypothetical protein
MEVAEWKVVRAVVVAPLVKPAFDETPGTRGLLT